MFDKIDALYQKRNELEAEASLNSEQLRLIERVHLDFVRAGATLSEQAKQEFADIKAALASLTTEFTQNVMKDGMSMSEVAFSLGYADQAAFSTAFKRWTGVTPRSFRQLT